MREGPAAAGGSGRFRERARIPLSEVLDRLHPVSLLGRVEGLAITDVEYDHRRVAGGELFCCLVGEHSDGHDFAAEAVQAGAVALLCERPLETVSDVTQIVVGPGGARAAMAPAACAVNRDPASELRTVGVTGTNGKTTTTFLLRSVLEAAGWPTQVIGTLSGARTTPEAPDLQRQLRAAVAGGAGAVALEVTSHALVQHRVDGYVHDVAVFTNLSQDHLDYHGTMERYFEAKAALFTPGHALSAVVNADDAYGERLLTSASIPLSTFRLSDAQDLEISFGVTRFLLEGQPVTLHLAGEPNVRNALAAAAAARTLGVVAPTIAEGLSAASGVPGRFERVENALGASAVVDYAHTPAALREALAAMRSVGDGGRLLVVFGAGGDRDREKRPLMGHEATHGADVAIVTSDNPRHEEAAAIIEEILAGCDGPAEIVVEPDRRAAISLALRSARPGDVVLVAGKGHESTQQVGDDFFDFDDGEVIRQAATKLADNR